MRLDNLHAPLTYKIIGAARRVYKSLWSGFLEKVYVNALALELSEAGLKVGIEHPVNVYYRGALVGSYFADIVVDDLIILEIKAIEALASVHEVQLVNYLKATRIELGLLI